MLPPGGYDWRATAIPVGDDLIPGRRQSLPAAFRAGQTDSFKNPGLTFFEIHLKEGRQIAVENFGIPFCNPDHPAEQWLRRNQPFFDEVTLQHIMNLRSVYLVVVKSVAEVEQMASVPVRPDNFAERMYGQSHGWDIKRYAEQRRQPGFRGKTFQASESFKSDNQEIAVVSQSVVQDYMWLHDAKKEILARQLPAYFIPCEDSEEGNDRKYFVVLYLDAAFRLGFEDAWRVFVKEGARKRVRLFTRWNEDCGYASESDDGDTDTKKKPCPDWDAMIIDGAQGIASLKPHLRPRNEAGKLDNDIEELVLCVYRPGEEDTKHVPDFQLVKFDSLQAARQKGEQS